MKEHIRNKRLMTQGRFFYTERDMAIAKRDEHVVRARANREKTKIIGVNQYPCCGDEGCFVTLPVETSDAKLIKNPKRPTKYD